MVTEGGTMSTAGSSPSSSHGMSHMRDLQSSKVSSSLPKTSHRKISRNRKLQSELDQCKADLAVCSATTAQEQLFVEIAGSCYFDRKDATYTLVVTDVDPAIYTLSGRPWSSASSIVTSFFNTYVFNNVYNSTFHEVSIMFHGKDDFAFGGPLVSTMIEATDMYVTTNRTNRRGRVKQKYGVWYKYQLRQSPQQEEVSPLDELFGGFINDSVNATTPTYSQCLIIVADPVPTTALPPNQRGDPPNDNSFGKGIFESDSSSDELSRTADTFDLTSISKDARISKWAQWTTNQGFSYTGKPIDPKDFVSGLSAGARSLAQTIKSCTTVCDTKTVLDGLGSFLLSVAFVAGAAFPVSGVVLAAIGTIATITAIFLPGAKTSSLPTLTSMDIQSVIENALSKYSTSQAVADFEAVQVFAQIDLEIYKEFINNLGYVKATAGANAQAAMDQQIKNWSHQWYAVWTKYFDAMNRSVRKEG